MVVHNKREYNFVGVDTIETILYNEKYDNAILMMLVGALVILSNAYVTKISMNIEKTIRVKVISSTNLCGNTSKING